jgi:hypothetical protein
MFGFSLTDSGFKAAIGEEDYVLNSVLLKISNNFTAGRGGDFLRVFQTNLAFIKKL